MSDQLQTAYALAISAILGVVIAHVVHALLSMVFT